MYAFTIPDFSTGYAGPGFFLLLNNSALRLLLVQVTYSHDISVKRSLPAVVPVHHETVSQLFRDRSGLQHHSHLPMQTKPD